MYYLHIWNFDAVPAIMGNGKCVVRGYGKGSRQYVVNRSGKGIDTYSLWKTE